MLINDRSHLWPWIYGFEHMLWTCVDPHRLDRQEEDVVKWSPLNFYNIFEDERDQFVYPFITVKIYFGSSILQRKPSSVRQFTMRRDRHEIRSRFGYCGKLRSSARNRFMIKGAFLEIKYHVSTKMISAWRCQESASTEEFYHVLDSIPINSSWIFVGPKCSCSASLTSAVCSLTFLSCNSTNLNSSHKHFVTSAPFHVCMYSRWASCHAPIFYN